MKKAEYWQGEKFILLYIIHLCLRKFCNIFYHSLLFYVKTDYRIT